jgi:hypothetical protein
LIHVRAKQLDTLSYIYTKLIELPDTLPLPMSTLSRPILDLPVMETGHITQEIIHLETAEASFAPIYVFNVYGQLIKTGIDRSILIQELKERYPAGVYFLVEQPIPANRITAMKLFINR